MRPFPMLVAQLDGTQGPSAGTSLVYLIVAVVTLAGMWKVFQKAGKPGWAAIVPIYNIIVLLQIVEKPLWWAILVFIPLVNLVMLVVIFIELAQRFGKSALYGIGLAFLGFIFFPLLGFGDARYQARGAMSAPGARAA